MFLWYNLGNNTDQTWFDTNYRNEKIGPDQHDFIDAKSRCTHSYGNYSSLSDALHECEQDNNCQVVFNYDCDDQNFTLCQKLQIHPSSLVHSCIYKKRKNT